MMKRRKFDQFPSTTYARRWCLMRAVLVMSLISMFVSATDDEHAMGSDTSQDELLLHLQDWFVSKGGLRHEGLEIRTVANERRLYANTEIAENEILLEIPQSVSIAAATTDITTVTSPSSCKSAALVEEWRRGNHSDYFPFVNYLASISLSSPSPLPSMWSEDGKRLLLEVLGSDYNHEDDETSITSASTMTDLPPDDSISWATRWNKTSCHMDENGIRAATLFLQYSWEDAALVPFFDMFKRGYQIQVNAKVSVAVVDAVRSNDDEQEEQAMMRIHALRTIPAGDEICISHNKKRLEEGYGTPEILRDYGRVETYPQRWGFNDNMDFAIIEDEDDEEDTVVEGLRVEWLGQERPHDDAIWFFLLQLERLDQFDKVDEPTTAPEGELRIIREYKEALQDAMDLSLWNLCEDDTEENDEQSCALARQYMQCRMEDGDDSTCPLLKRYDDLGEQEDPLFYAPYTCVTDFGAWYDGMEEIEDLQSHYQLIAFAKDHATNDVCFSIGDTVQICNSYRPQYHEMAVHYTARFLESVKRVLWVGGGDSMLLHEILKYPSIELAVGLELDQTITRYSFLHMGTQPHFDNEKVEWWYGDAAKSLLMLPADYFGSFDMVLVDLSETVMSLSVTSELDILQALSLLLKPDGIFVKNELYMDKFSELFQYSLQINYPSVPVVCSQCMNLGSNRIDFLNDQMRDHELDTLYIQPLSSIEDPYEYVHDYRHNTTAQRHCRADDAFAQEEESAKNQTSSPGVLMIVEAEDIKGNLKDSAALLLTVETTLAEEGFHTLSRMETTVHEKPTVTVILQEGYVNVRTWPEHRYAAIDIHLWSAFEKHDAARNAIVEAIGGRAIGRFTSSYRIVAGGMYGTETWKEDEMKRGPRATDPCTAEEPTEESRASTTNTKKQTVETLILKECANKLIGGTDPYVAVVLCGEKGKPCQGVNALKKAKGDAKVLPLWTCSGLSTDSNEYSQGFTERMAACELELGDSLDAFLASNKQKIRALVIDSSASYAIGRIAYEIILSDQVGLLEDDLLVLSVLLDDDDDDDDEEEDESWRRNLMERFRSTIIVNDPNFRTEVLFNTTEGGRMELGVSTSVDDHFVGRLLELVAHIEQDKKTKIDSEVRMIKGGQFVEDPDWEWEYFFGPEHYDQQPALGQWFSQQPLAYQVLMQLEVAASVHLSLASMMSFVEVTLYLMDSEELADAVPKISTDAGSDGCVIVTPWSGGSFLVLWDGRNHIDVNWFANDNESFELPGFFLDILTSQFPQDTLTVALVDEQPRGIGRVVNFQRDLSLRVQVDENNEPQGRVEPHWAKEKETS